MSRASSSSACSSCSSLLSASAGTVCAFLSLESAYRIPPANPQPTPTNKLTTSPASVAVEDDLPGDAAMGEAAAELPDVLHCAAGGEAEGGGASRMEMALSLNGSVHEEGVWSLPSHLSWGVEGGGERRRGVLGEMVGDDGWSLTATSTLGVLRRRLCNAMRRSPSLSMVRRASSSRNESRPPSER